MRSFSKWSSLVNYLGRSRESVDNLFFVSIRQRVVYFDQLKFKNYIKSIVDRLFCWLNIFELEFIKIKLGRKHKIILNCIFFFFLLFSFFLNIFILLSGLHFFFFFLRIRFSYGFSYFKQQFDFIYNYVGILY